MKGITLSIFFLSTCLSLIAAESDDKRENCVKVWERITKAQYRSSENESTLGAVFGSKVKMVSGLSTCHPQSQPDDEIGKILMSVCNRSERRVYGANDLTRLVNFRNVGHIVLENRKKVLFGIEARGYPETIMVWLLDTKQRVWVFPVSLKEPEVELPNN